MNTFTRKNCRVGLAPPFLRQTVSILGLWSVILVLVLSGCGQQQGDMTIEQITVPNSDKADAMEITETILAEMNFEIEKADANNGYIRTRPLPGAQFFELWRSDNTGANNCLLSNLHSIRRTVEISLSGPDDRLQIDCNVQIERLSIPEQDISGTGRAYRMFSRSKPTLQRLTLNPKQAESMAWEDLGRDEQLETKILRRIWRQIGTNAAKSVSITSKETKAAGSRS
jgi:hypothetical protein